MYVSLPQNYSGTAFSREEEHRADERPPVPPTLPQVQPPREKRPPDREHCSDERQQHEKKCPQDHEPQKKQCDECRADDKNPFSCLLNALRRGKSGGIDAEDFLLLGLIALLIGKEGNEDIVLILTMLLLI